MEAVRRNRSSKTSGIGIGNEWLASANHSVRESVFTMRVTDHSIECPGSRSDGKTERNELTYRRQHITCRVCIIKNLS